MNKSTELLEAIKKNEHGYYECPHGCSAIYHTYSFTHNPFQCKDCNNMFGIPKGIKLNKPRPFKKHKKVTKEA